MSNIVFQGTVCGPTLGNAFVVDASCVFLSAVFCIIIYADDLNAFKAYDRKVANTTILPDLQSKQLELRRWDFANRATFDVLK